MHSCLSPPDFRPYVAVVSYLTTGFIIQQQLRHMIEDPFLWSVMQVILDKAPHGCSAVDLFTLQGKEVREQMDGKVVATPQLPVPSLTFDELRGVFERTSR